MKKIGKGMAAFVCVIIFATAAMSAYEILPSTLGNVNSTVASMLGAVLSIVLILAGLLLSAKIEGKTLADYGISWSKREPKKLLIGLLIGIGAFLMVVIPLYLLKVYELNTSHHSWEKIVNQLFLFIAVGFLEEYLCRGFIQHHLLRFGPYTALMLTSIIFSLLHLGNPGITPLALINIALAGTLMGSVMYALNSIHAAVGVHITWNWIQGAIFGIPVSGTTPSGYFSTTILSNNQLLTGGDFGVEGSVACTIITFLLTVNFLIIALKNRNWGKFAEKWGK
ncbi:lysostaphin resistance A-like protein [Enterococcus sp. AZ007]|uniref:CPBP family intramembrane glutamic endopeptidase n=1 Tax=Enterococcus sp. AZ007 TaxID=2774839 RepID=UPI003F2262AC